MDESIAKALKRRDELRRELEKIDRFVTAYVDLFGPIHSGDSEAVEKSADEQVAALPVEGSEKRRGATPDDIADAADRAIRASGHPMTRGQLVEALEAEGVEFASDDRARYLGTILWRNGGRFVNLRGKGYFLPDLMSDDDFNALAEAKRRKRTSGQYSDEYEPDPDMQYAVDREREEELDREREEELDREREEERERELELKREEEYDRTHEDWRS